MFGFSCRPRPATYAAGDQVYGLTGEKRSVSPEVAELIRNRTPTRTVRHPLATITDSVVGPFLARTPHLGLAAYLGSIEGAKGRWLTTIPLSRFGEGTGQPRAAAQVADEATHLVLKPTAGERPGFIAVWRALTNHGTSLHAIALDEAGASTSTPRELTQTNDNILWFDVIQTPNGALSLWAEENRQGAASLLALELDLDGKPRGVPVRVIRDIIGWNAIAHHGGVGLAIVLASSQNSTRSKGGALGWLELNEHGQARQPITIIDNRTAVRGAVDAVSSQGEVFFAWTDRTAAEPSVYLASIGADGRVRRPFHPFKPAQSSTVIGLVASKKGTVGLAWEEVPPRPRAIRLVRLARIEKGGSIGAEGASPLEVRDREIPQWVGTEDGFGLLMKGRACDSDPREDVTACVDAPVTPLFLSIDEALSVVRTEPLWVDDDYEPPALAWGLQCAEQPCLALAAKGGLQTSIVAIELGSAATQTRSPERPLPPPDAPRLGLIGTIASGQAFSDLAALPIGSRTMIALLGGSSNGPSSGTLATQLVDSQGNPVNQPIVLSTRAMSEGGVALSRADKVEDGVAVGWVALEKGLPQVHITRVDHYGRRMKDIQLTTSARGASEVALAWTPGGWIVGWVDQRDGRGEVYATKVSPDLHRIAREERITRVTGDASGVALLTRPEGVWITWADPRESPHDGSSDIFMALLRPRDATRATRERLVQPTAAHSRSPVLVPANEQGDMVLSWIEDAPEGVDTSHSTAYGAMVALLDKKGEMKQGPVLFRGAGEGLVTAINVHAIEGQMRMVLARSTNDEVVLDAGLMTIEPWTTASFYPLMSLEGPPTAKISMALLPDELYFADAGLVPSDRRVRRAPIAFRVKPPQRPIAENNDHR